jgi:hypothetical protein
MQYCQAENIESKFTRKVTSRDASAVVAAAAVVVVALYIAHKGKQFEV